MEIVRLYRLSCLDQERLRKEVQIVLDWPKVLMIGFNSEWIHRTSPCTAVHLLMRRQISNVFCPSDDMQILCFEITGDYAVFKHTIVDYSKLIVIFTLLRTWMPWLFELMVQQIPGFERAIQRLWIRSNLSDVRQNAAWKWPAPEMGACMLTHFLDPSKEYFDESDPWMLHFICYAILHNWWNGFTAEALELVQFNPDGDFWLCDPCLPDIYVVVYPFYEAMRFSFRNPTRQFPCGRVRYFFYEVKQAELLLLLQSLCQAHSSNRAQDMHHELASHGLYTALIDLVLQYT